MKNLITPLIILASTFGTAQAAQDSLANSMKNATISGQFRAAYISQSPDGAIDTTATALGGHIKLETAPWNNMTFAIAPYFSEKIDFLSGDEEDGELNTDFFDEDGDSFAYLGEAYVDYQFNNGAVRVGRQSLDTPFINPDDIRLFANTFAAAWLTMDIAKDMKLQAGKVNSWAGFDSGDDQGDFKEVGDDGVIALGVNYTVNKELDVQGWFYDFDEAFSLVYLDGIYTTGDWEFGAQYASFDEESDSGIDGRVLGVSVAYSMDQWTFGFAMNTASNDDGKAPSVGLGEGGFFAVMHEMTLDGLNDVDAYVLSAEYDVNDKLNVSAALGQFEDDANTADISELDIIVSYTVSDNLDVEFYLIDVENDDLPNDPDTNFDRQMIRATYTF